VLNCFFFEHFFLPLNSAPLPPPIWHASFDIHDIYRAATSQSLPTPSYPPLRDTHAEFTRSQRVGEAHVCISPCPPSCWLASRIPMRWVTYAPPPPFEKGRASHNPPYNVAARRHAPLRETRACMYGGGAGRGPGRIHALRMSGAENNRHTRGP
jgi:hypothetical protein